MAAAMAAPAPAHSYSQSGDTHGVESYYQQKLDDIDLQIRERTENLQRLRAQRNELNSRGL
jgi:26S proteasome regulatory subunit T6